ncbi:hypothetical protein NOBGBDLN_00737 [[Clostridium] scindens]|nr:hypothetical protein [[Clostridium] scindens]WPB42816.1 hypothetical protein NOBGBDLN_00737 [[Clostridium] scindens]
MELGKIIAFNLKRLRMERNLSQVNITVRQSRQSGVARATCPD